MTTFKLVEDSDANYAAPFMVLTEDESISLVSIFGTIDGSREGEPDPIALGVGDMVVEMFNRLPELQQEPRFAEWANYCQERLDAFLAEARKPTLTR